MGVFAPVSAQMGPSAQPPFGTSGIFRRMFLQNNLQTAPPAPQESYIWGGGKLKKKYSNFLKIIEKIEKFEKK